MLAATKLNIKKLISDFPVLRTKVNGVPLIYLDNAATTQKPGCVIDKVIRYYTRENANVHRSLHTLGELATAEYEMSRRTIKEFIGAENVEEIIFTGGTTEGINLVAASWGERFLNSGDTILLTEMEHHSNLIPWQLLAERKGLNLKFIPFNDRGNLELEQLDALWDETVRFVSVVHVSNALGTINPVKKIIEYAHNKGAKVLVDAAQSVPHFPVNVGELDCDFLAFSGHKMCGPTGIGVLYGKKELLDSMPPYMGGGEMIKSVRLESSTWNDLPYKFEAGTPNICGAIGLGRAAEYLAETGLNAIRAYVEELTEYGLKKLNTLDGITLYGPPAQKRSGIISFNLDNIHAHDVAQFLDGSGIAVRAGHHCAQPVMKKLNVPATARASFYFYNTKEQIDRLYKELIKIKEFFL